MKNETHLMEEQRRLRRLLATQGVSTGADGGSGDAGGEHRAPHPSWARPNFPSRVATFHENTKPGLGFLEVCVLGREASYFPDFLHVFLVPLTFLRCRFQGSILEFLHVFLVPLTFCGHVEFRARF